MSDDERLSRLFDAAKQGNPIAQGYVSELLEDSAVEQVKTGKSSGLVATIGELLRRKEKERASHAGMPIRASKRMCLRTGKAKWNS